MNNIATPTTFCRRVIYVEAYLFDGTNARAIANALNRYPIECSSDGLALFIDGEYSVPPSSYVFTEDGAVRAMTPEIFFTHFRELKT